jgi:hypothetical protein
MRRSLWLKRLAVVLVFAAIIAPATVSSQPRTGVLPQPRTGLGLGVMLGQPSGISAIMWLGGGNAIDAVAAWSFLGGGSLYLHADYQFHAAADRPLTFYTGLGGFVQFADDPEIGFRVPLGISYLFEQAPFDIFAEIGPSMALIPETRFLLNGGIGFRIYF